MRRVSYKFRDVQREGFLHTWIRDADGDPCGIVEDKVTGGIRPILCTNITMLPEEPANKKPVPTPSWVCHDCVFFDLSSSKEPCNLCDGGSKHHNRVG